MQFGFIRRVNNITYELVDLNTGNVLVDTDTGEILKNKKAYLINYLHTHDEFRVRYLEMVRKFIAASNDMSLLDKETLKEIEAEESAVEVKDNLEPVRREIVDDTGNG